MEKKYAIGYTTGVFDLFHVGHLNIIKKSKAMCDKLIVGVSTDELVRNYKGKNPVIPYEERVEIVNAIKFVDIVVPQYTLDKYNAWEKYHFNVMFHGDDWKNKKEYIEIVQKLQREKVDIVFFPYTRGVSTTELIKKM